MKNCIMWSMLNGIEAYKKCPQVYELEQRIEELETALESIITLHPLHCTHHSENGSCKNCLRCPAMVARAQQALKDNAAQKPIGETMADCFDKLLKNKPVNP